MFKRSFSQFRKDQENSEGANVPSYVFNNGQIVATNSSLPPVALGPPIQTGASNASTIRTEGINSVQIIDDTVPRRRLIQSRRINQNPYQPNLSQRENLLSLTGITSQYENQSEEYRQNIINVTNNNWIFSSRFAEGANAVGRNMATSNFFVNSNVNTTIGHQGIVEFMQFLENLIQRFLLTSARELQDLNEIDSQSFEYTQRLVNTSRNLLNENIRELFYRYYNDAADGQYGNIRWNGDTRKIIERVIDQIQRHFIDQPDLSRFGQLIPTLTRRASTIGGVRRSVYELNSDEGKDYLMLLFAIVMIRLPSVNVARNNVMDDISRNFRLPIRYPNELRDEFVQMSMADTNLRSLFYFIPEQRRVVGLWNNVAYVNDSEDQNNRRPFYWNYKTDLIRNIIYRIQIPTAIRENEGQLDFENLFSNDVNLYSFLRLANPFQASANENQFSRYYVSMSVYAEGNQSILHIPWILEGSLSNGVAFDINNFLQEYERVITSTDSGKNVTEVASDANVFYIHFMLLHDPNLPLSRIASNSRQNTRVRMENVSGMLVGSPYAGTPKEKHFLLGSMVHRFKNTAALFRVPAKKLHTCLMMSLLKCQLYEYIFQNGKCIDIRTTGNVRNGTCCYHVESIQNWSTISRLYPFLEKLNDKIYIKLFNPYKYKEEEKYYEGCLDEEEECAWEKAAEEIWFHLENFYQKQINYTSLQDFGQIFCNFFNVCISIYDVEMRCNRVHILTPHYKNAMQLVHDDQKISMVHLVYDQGHMHPITNLQAFVKSQARKDDIRLHNYCPICDQKQITELRKNKKDTLHHISECIKKEFHCGFDHEKKHEATIVKPEIKLAWKKNEKTQKMCCYTACVNCGDSVNQQTFLYHMCKIKPKKNKILKNENIYVYDLECAQFIDELNLFKHECNCLFLRKVYPDNEIEKQGIYFPSEIEFIEELLVNPIYLNAVFIAHNGGNYDVHFILRVLERREIQHTYIPSPTSKHKFLQIHLNETNIRFIDFMRFVPGSLKSIAESFAIPVGKGEFPHKFNNGKHDSYVGAFPSKDCINDYWNINSFRTKKDEEHFLEWYNLQCNIYCTCEDECVCTKLKWNFQHEIKKYCLQDVIVLAEIVKAFRTECMTFESEKDELFPDSLIAWNAPCLDPLQFMTLPQITIQTLVQGFEDVSIISYNEKKNTYSTWKSLAWLYELQSTYPYPILHKGNCLKKYYDFNTNTYMDGFCVQTNTVFLFLSCEFWACPICYPQLHETNALLESRNLYAVDVRNMYQAWITELTVHYKVISIWEHEFNEMIYDEEDKILYSLMKPEDAFYGGRTEVFQLYAHAERCRSEIQYYDVTSLYPSVYAHYPLPVGVPIHLIGDAIDHHRFHPTSSNRYFGYARVKVIPNRSDLIGLLPQRDSETGRLFFPVLPMVGCWGTEEIYLAMQHGYMVTKIYELYHWEQDQYSDQYLRGYVGYFLRMKQEAEGWKKLGASSDNPTEDEKIKIMRELYVQNGNIGKIRIDRVEKNPVKRQLAKLYLNALWGKFAQKSSKCQHSTVYGLQQFLSLWNDKTIVQSSCFFREISPGVYKASYNLKEEFLHSVKHGNLFIAAKVTETARCVLHTQMLRIGPERIIYCDTDSIIFLWDSITQLTGIGLGKWTNEYPNDKIIQVYALAPKLYSLLLQKEHMMKETFRVKGVQMTLVNQQKMAFEHVKPLIESLLKFDPTPLSLSVKNFSIFTNSGNNALPYGQVFTRYNEKKVKAIITKRIYQLHETIDWSTVAQLRTFPYGYDGSIT